MPKRIFVGVDYSDSYFYLVGLNSLFEFIFFKSFSVDELSSMHQFMKDLRSAHFTYRVPFFSCFFKRFSYSKYFSIQSIEPLTAISTYQHAIFYLGFSKNTHDYEVAYLSEFDYQEQMQLLGACADFIDLVEIDSFALQLMQSQGLHLEDSPWGLAKALAIRGFYADV
ncbi:MAG TPA: hypothetical protein DCZ80_07645 [Legionellales bacterium]|nr:hypothetical protein [Legionellales bacterium]